MTTDDPCRPPAHGARHHPRCARARRRPGPVRRRRRVPRHRARPARGPSGPAARARRQVPGEARRRVGPRVHRLPRPAQRLPRPGQGRAAVPPPGRPGRRPRPRDVDDLEVRPGRRAVRRREGRRDVRSARDERQGAGGGDAPVRDRAGADRRAGPRHPRARRGDQRPGHGLVHGHDLDAQGPLGAGCRHRQAAVHRRLGRTRRGHRPWRPVHDRGRREPPRVRPRGRDASRSRASATSATPPRACCTRPARRSSPSRTSAAACTTLRVSTSRRSRCASARRARSPARRARPRSTTRRCSGSTWTCSSSPRSRARSPPRTPVASGRGSWPRAPTARSTRPPTRSSTSWASR